MSHELLAVTLWGALVSIGLIVALRDRLARRTCPSGHELDEAYRSLMAFETHVAEAIALTRPLPASPPARFRPAG